MTDFIADEFVVGSQRYRIRVQCQSTGALLWAEGEREPGEWSTLDQQTYVIHAAPQGCGEGPHYCLMVSIDLDAEDIPVPINRAAQSVIKGWFRDKGPVSTEPFDARLANAVDTLRNAIEKGLREAQDNRRRDMREDREAVCKVETTCRDMGWPELEV